MLSLAVVRAQDPSPAEGRQQDLAANAARARASDPPCPAEFDKAKDLIALHYDHAKDPDDGHSAAADRTMLESLYGRDWIEKHVLPVSGAYGKNKHTFVPASDALMRAVWNECGGWVSAHDDWPAAVQKLVERWGARLRAGGRIWVKEGGQSDITAEAVKILKAQMPKVAIEKRVVVVQHGKWNELQTHEEALAYVKKETTYVKIHDANPYLRIKSDASPGNLALRGTFVQVALAHPRFGASWKAAFDYYDPDRRQLDFSDTGELLYIVGLGAMDIDAFRQRFLNPDAGGKR